MATTALILMDSAFKALNVFQAGEPIPPNDAADALVLMNNMVARWALDTQIPPMTARDVFALVAGQGGPSNPYSIGPTGNFVMARPPSQAAILGAGILLGNTSPTIEVGRTVLDDEQYQSIPIKELQNVQFTFVYYNQTYAGGLGAINLWPVPNTNLHSLVLYHRAPLGAFSTNTASYDLPQGYEEAIVYNLAIRLAIPYGKPVTPELAALAVGSLAAVKRANTSMSDLPVDPMFLPQRGHGGGRPTYNIVTGQGG